MKLLNGGKLAIPERTEQKMTLVVTYYIITESDVY